METTKHKLDRRMRSSMFGKKKDEKEKSNPSIAPILQSVTHPTPSVTAPSNTTTHTTGSGTVLSPRSMVAASTGGSVREARVRSSTVATMSFDTPKSGSSSFRARKTPPRPSVISPRSEESSEHKYLRQVLPDFLRGIGFKESDVFEMSSLGLQKLHSYGPDLANIPPKFLYTHLKKAKTELDQICEEARKAAAAVTIQSVVRMHLARKRYLVIKNGPINQYLQVINEMLKTEQEYYDKLSSIIKQYKEPLLARNIIDNTVSDSLFGNVEAIRAIHARILQHLLVVKADPSQWETISTIGAFFLFIAASINKTYTDYAKEYAVLCERIDSLQASNPKFESFMLEVTKTNAKMNLPHLLQILPLPLSNVHTLESYLEKFADVAKENRGDFICALGVLQNTSTFLDKKRDDFFTETQMIRLSKKIQCDTPQQLQNIFNGSRKLIREGEFTSDKATKRHVFLLNDLCLITKPNPAPVNAIKTYQLEKAIPLDDCTFTDNPTYDGGRRFLQKGTEVLGFEFKISEGTFRLFANTQEEKNQWVKEIKSIVDQLTKTRVFGVPLKTLLERERRIDTGVPLLVEQLVRYIRSTGMTEEGILRVSGTQNDLNTLRQLIDRGEPNISFKDYSLPTICSLFKLYWRELPEPLLTFDLYEPLIAIQEQDLSLDVRLDQVQALIRKLPSTNKKLLKYLMEFLSEIASHSDKNKMSPQNLSIVMTPGLVRSKNQTPRTALQAPLANALTELLIDFYDDILGDVSAGSVIVKKPKRQVNEEYKTISIQYKRLSVHFKKFQLELEETLTSPGRNNSHNPK